MPKKSKADLEKKIDALEATDQMILKRMGHMAEVLKKEETLIEREAHELGKMEREQGREELLKKGRIDRFEVHDFAQIVIGTIVFAGPEMFATDFWDFLEHVPVQNILGLHVLVVLTLFVTYYYRYFPFKQFDFEKLKRITKRILYIYFPVMLTVLVLLFTFNVIVPNDPAIEFVKKTVIAQTVGMIGAVTFEFIVG